MELTGKVNFWVVFKKSGKVKKTFWCSKNCKFDVFKSSIRYGSCSKNVKNDTFSWSLSQGHRNSEGARKAVHAKRLDEGYLVEVVNFTKFCDRLKIEYIWKIMENDVFLLEIHFWIGLKTNKKTIFPVKSLKWVLIKKMLVKSTN